MRAAVMRQLAMLEDLAEHGEPESLLPLARSELHRLADGWRLLLTVHQPGADGRCRVCPGPLRRRRWPCRVWLLAYQHLIGEGPLNRRKRHALRRAGAKRRETEAKRTPTQTPITEQGRTAVTDRYDALTPPEGKPAGGRDASEPGWRWPRSTDPWPSSVVWPGP